MLTRSDKIALTLLAIGLTFYAGAKHAMPSFAFDTYLANDGSYATNSTVHVAFTQRAQGLGANAIVGIDIDYETIGNNGSMLMVATSGTAVKTWACISLSDSTSRRPCVVNRSSSVPASIQRRAWFTEPSISLVSVLAIVCTRMG